MTVVKSEPVINTTSPSPSWILDHLRAGAQMALEELGAGPPADPVMDLGRLPG